MLLTKIPLLKYALHSALIGTLTLGMSTQVLAKASFKQYKTVEIEGDCKHSCAKFEALHPLSDQPELNQLILRHFSDHSPEKEAQKLFQEFKAVQKDIPSFVQSWEVEHHIKLIHNGAFLSLRHNYYGYTGGAHGNSWSSFLNIRWVQQKPQPFFVDSLLLKEKREAFRQLAEKHFRIEKELSPTEHLNKAGFDFKNNHFDYEPKNLLLSPKGITVRFNTYAIAPYVYGPTEYTLPLSEVLPLLNKKDPLVASLLK